MSRCVAPCDHGSTQKEIEAEPQDAVSDVVKNLAKLKLPHNEDFNREIKDLRKS
jgi:hypothetical protein